MGWNILQEENQISSGVWDRKDFIQCIKSIVDLLSRRRLWWNPDRKILPAHFIERRLAYKRLTDSCFEIAMRYLTEHTLFIPQLATELFDTHVITLDEFEFFNGRAVSLYIILFLLIGNLIFS